MNSSPANATCVECVLTCLDKSKNLDEQVYKPQEEFLITIAIQEFFYSFLAAHGWGHCCNCTSFANEVCAEAQFLLDDANNNQDSISHHSLLMSYGRLLLHQAKLIASHKTKQM